MRKTMMFLVTGLLLSSLAAAAAEFWEKKKYLEWSEKECRKLLQDSPWARQYNITSTHIDPTSADPVTGPDTDTFPDASEGGLDTDVGLRGREPNPRLTYLLQLRSALPIRQALVRQQQIQIKYAELAPEKKQEFDAAADRFLAVEFPDKIIVFVTFSSNVHFDERELTHHWQNQTTDTLKNFVFLIGSRGVKAPLLEYIKAEGSPRAFQFVFPRQVEGQPLLAANSKGMQLEFPHPNIRNQGERRILVEFKAQKMLVDGELVY